MCLKADKLQLCVKLPINSVTHNGWAYEKVCFDELSN
jgi:hypothetical protein